MVGFFETTETKKEQEVGKETKRKRTGLNIPPLPTVSFLPNTLLILWFFLLFKQTKKKREPALLKLSGKLYVFFGKVGGY